MYRPRSGRTECRPGRRAEPLRFIAWVCGLAGGGPSLPSHSRSTGNGPRAGQYQVDRKLGQRVVLSFHQIRVPTARTPRSQLSKAHAVPFLTVKPGVVSADLWAFFAGLWKSTGLT